MSLNGLDEPKVAEAFAAAAAEAGGWFLLKYASRDEVELLGKGTGGIPEVRDAISGYEDASPLYGFLRYRRRNVVIKHLPEGCSRLVQARVAVHFTAVCERFSPHDATFEMSAPVDLTNRKLSAACSLHAASGSNSSSSSSVRRRRLNEIAEEDEDEQRAAKRQSLHDGPEDDPDAQAAESAGPPVKLDAELAASPDQSKFAAATTAIVPSFIGAADGRPEDLGDSNRRMSSQSSRQDVFGYSVSASSKPKIKLGPRPSLDVGGRPQTAGNFRPVSSIPAGFKLFGKNGKRSRARDDSTGTIASLPEGVIVENPFTASALPIPEEPAKSNFDIPRPATSSGVSTKAPSMAPTVGKSAMTPEKARLKKAMQLREKKKKLKNQPPMPELPVLLKAAPEGTEDASAPAVVPAEVAEETLVETPKKMVVPAPEKRLAMVKADSAIAINASPVSTNTDESSELTQSDSRPTSPVIASSEPDHSTKASSLSESTDETVQAKDDGERPGEDLPRPVDERTVGQNTPDEDKTPTLEDAQHEQAIPEDAATNGESTPVSVLLEIPEEAVADERETPTQTGPGVMKVSEPTKTTEMALPTESASLEVEDQTSAHDAAEVVDEPAVEERVLEVPIIQPLSTEEPTIQGPTIKEPVSIPDSESDPAPGAHDDIVQETVAPPVSKFSTNIPTVANASQGRRPSLAVTETSRIPEADNASQAATSTDHESPLAPLEAADQQPVSKDDLRAAAKAAANPLVVDQSPSAPPAHSTDEPARDREDSEADLVSAKIRPAKRRTLIEPIRTDLVPPPESRPESRADTNFSDDDSLLEELQSATVHEAKPMFVVKTPMTPSFPGPLFPNASSVSPAGGPGSPRAHVVRTVSTPARPGTGTGAPTDVSQSSARTVSSSGAAYLHRVTQQHTAAGGGSGSLAAKKLNMGSRISQRIKALEMLSGSAGEEAAPAQTGAAVAGGASSRSRPSSTFFSVGKGRVASRSPSVLERASSFASHAPPPPSSSATQSRESSPETERQTDRKRSGSVASRLSRFESGASRGRPESISVTARIVREPEHVGAYRGSEGLKEPSQYGHLELKQSPLVVAHQKASPPSLSPSRETIRERRQSKDSRRSSSQGVSSSGRRSRRSSLTIVKDYIKEKRKSLTTSSMESPIAPPPARSPARPPSTHQNNSIASRLSFSSHRSSLSRDHDQAMSPSAWTEGSGSGDEVRSISSGGFSGDGKKKSRTGRLMRRLSTLGSRGRNSISSGLEATVAEEDGMEPQTPPPASSTRSRPSTTATSIATTAPSVVAMQHLGDVNVQFPDTLLWKRRNLSVDGQGFVILSALQSNGQGSIGAAGGRATASGAQTHTRRYHLGELRGPPYVPDVEVQELPNSVVLDLVSGGGVQIACEDRTGQLAVLHVLQDAHAGQASTFGM